MNAQLKPVTPRQQLAAAIQALNAHQQDLAVADAIKKRIEQTLAAEAAAQQACDAISAAEDAEFAQWVERGETGPEPKPHGAERKTAERSLKLAHAHATSARSQQASLIDSEATLAARYKPLHDALHLAKLSVITGIGIEQGAQFKRQIFTSFRAEAIVTACATLLMDQHGNFEAVGGFTTGDPTTTRQRAAAGVSVGWMALWDALDHDATAELRV